MLDTSALLAFIEAEDGADRVREVLARDTASIPFAAILELRYITLRERGQAEADMRHALLKQTGAEIIWSVDEPVLLTAARYKASYRLSLGDAMIAAYARMRGAVLIHKDPEFAALSGELRMERLPFKPAVKSRRDMRHAV